MKVGLVGFGISAERFHAPLIAAEKGLKLTHVVERHKRRAEELYRGITTLRSAEELWASDVGVAVILTPNESHFALARAALEAGKHVVVDKPFTISSAQANELIAVSQRVGKVLTVFHNRRWDGDFLTVQELLKRGELGQLHRYESRWERFRPSPKGDWREEQGEGTGVLYDLGSHMIDQALCCFGPPSRVFCRQGVQRPGYASRPGEVLLSGEASSPGTTAVDSFDWIGDYGYLQVHLSSNCMTAAPAYRFLLMGNVGTYLKSGLDGQERALQNGQRPGGPLWGEEPQELWGETRRRVDGGSQRETIPTVPGDYPEFYRNLTETIQGRATLHVKPEQARDVMIALELSLESDRLGAWISWAQAPELHP